METLERDLCDIVREAEETAGLEGTDNRFHITDESSADWLLSKYAAIDAETALIQAQAEAAVKRLKSDREGLQRLFQSELESWAAEQIAADKRKRKSVILPHGTLAIRTVPGGLRITDAAAALAYAQQIGTGVEMKPTLDAELYRKAAQILLDTEGELIPGVDLVPERESFSIKFGSKE